MKSNKRLLVRCKRFLALLLAVTMVTGTLPSSIAYAAEIPAADTEDAGSVLSSDITIGDTESEDVEAAAEADSAVGGAVVYADTPVLTQYTFDWTAFDEEYKAVLPYGDSNIWDWKDQVQKTVRVLADGSDQGTLEYAASYKDIDIKYQWQVQEEDGWKDVASVGSSSKVGNYQLIITIDAVENKSAAADLKMAFEITKAEVEPRVNINDVVPGTLAQSVKVASAYISTDNGDYFAYSEDATTSKLALTLQIKDAYTGVAVSGQLLKTGDYIVEITPAFTDNVTKEQKDSYTLKPVVQKLQMAGLIKPDVIATPTSKWADPDNEGYFLDYSVVYTGEAVVAPVAPVDYTLQIQYWDGTSKNDDGTNKYTTINAGVDDLTYEWHDSSYSRDKLDSAPVNAGTYYYRITYNGQAGLYSSNYVDIKVVVTPKELTLMPKWKAETTPVFYPGMTVRDVLAAVTYVARNAAGAEETIDRDHIWGDYRTTYVTIPFEPVFKLQVDSGETNADNKKVYSDVDSSILVYDPAKPYRVIFSGEKAVYYGDGDTYTSYGINNYTYGDSNYKVKVDLETLELNVLPVSMLAGSVATIDVSDIPALEGTQAAQAGTTYENPYVKVYDGKALYEERANYKQAQVKGADGSALASGIDPTISYTWYRRSGTDYVWNSETNKNDEVPRWTTVGSSNAIPSNAGSFSNAGYYKLVVSYADPTNVNHAVPKEIFYKIEKQKIQIVPETTPVQVLTALTETDVDKFDFSQINYAIKTVVTTGESEVLQWTEGSEEEVDISEKDFWIEWKVEKKADNEQNYSTASGQFTKGISYRVSAKLHMRSGLSTNYTDYEYYTEGTGDAADVKTRYLNETWAITLADMGTTELKIEVDSNKLVNKVYDGTEYVIPEGAVKITKADGSPVSDVVPEYRWWSSNYDADYDEEKGEYRWPVHGGSYRLYVGFSGSTTYKAVGEKLVGSFEITRKNLSVEVVVDTEIKAGSGIANYDFPLTFTGYVDNDQDAFTWQGEEDADSGYYSAISSRGTSVKDEDGKSVYTFKGGKTYTAYANVSLRGNYARDYDPQSKGVKFTTVRDNSTVSAASYGSISSVALTDTVQGMTHTIKPEQGIDYINNYYLSGYSKSVSGNYFAFRITEPAEYGDVSSRDVWKDAFFKNSIENAGGYVLGYNENNYNPYITVAFDASAKDKKEFQIRWEEGYIENFTVDFSAAILGADLTKAVDPKSIAFNSPIKKMVVGGTQALDVKLTKKLQNDIICLQYTVSDEKVLCVDEDGYVVALDSGKADVTVTPVYKDEDGKLQPIQGAKSAKVTITVTDVTAPKVQKVAALDTSARVTYGQVSDGYRREVYVLKGKGIKADEFEQKIASMTNENWEGLFEVAPAYYDSYSSAWIVSEWWNKQAVYNITGLDPNTDYTVYVRNVSRARTLSDGCKVTVSGKGNVKSFKTTKHQVKALDLDFNEGEDKPVYYNQNGNLEVKLSTGSIKVDAWGRFQELPVYEAADTVDNIWVLLPIKDATQKKAYMAPKLVYQVAERITVSNTNNTPKVYYARTGNTYYIPTTYASVDKSGKIKLNGVGTVYVRVMDTTTGIACSWRRLDITATPDSIVGKSITFEVGQTIALEDLVDYKEGSLVLKGDLNSLDRHIVYDAELRKAVEDNDYFEMSGNWGITAVKPGGSLTLTLKDLYVGVDKTANVTVKTKALAAATGLKASYVVDNSATMSFNYNGLASKFKVEVTDGRGRVIQNKLYDKSSFADKTYDYELGYDMSSYDSGNYYYTDAKGKNYYFFHISGLAKLSSYSVTVTAIWQNGDSSICEAAKPVKKSIKTTKMPAAYGYLQKYEYGGVGVYYRGRYELSDDNPVTSGNTYELTVGSDDFELQSYAKNMLTDTLTWTSSNKKVATVKANAGTYTATMKAVKAGTTVIEVKSKVTKKVIARYDVRVYAVGTARYSYFGENERQSFYVSDISKRIYAKDSAAAKADYSFEAAIEGTGSGNTYTFTAPADGTYSFWTTGSSNTCGTLKDNDGNVLTCANGSSVADNNFKLSYELTAGEQVSIDVREWKFGDFAATLNISTEAAE